MGKETLTTFEWSNTWPIWLWLLLIFISLSLALWSYWGSQLAPPIRRLLVFLRFSTCLWAILLLAGPSLTYTTSNIVSDQVIFMFDQSSSMLTKDVPWETKLITRNEQLGYLLNSEKFPHIPTTKGRVFRWYGYQGNAYKIEPPLNSNGSQTHDNQHRTDLLSSLIQVVETNSSLPISSIVVFGDGRESQPIPQNLLATLQSLNTPVVSIPLGSPSRLNDVAIGSVSHPKKAFGNDPIQIKTQLKSRGDINTLGDITLSLLDKSSGKRLDTRTLSPTKTWKNGSTQVTLTGTPEAANNIDWQLVVTTTQPDLIQVNNTKPIQIEKSTKPIRVLYIDGRPRWEYRYLKNLLLREHSILSSTLLLSADLNFTQEGDRAIKRLPSTTEEFLEWDVLVLGDIAPSTLNSNQATIIKSLVSNGDLSIVWIGGEQWNPNQWDKSPLTELLPMFHPPLVDETNKAFNIQPTELGFERGIFHEDVVGTNNTKPNDLMYWTQLISLNDLKPSVEVLASTTIKQTNKPPTPTPIILSMRFGLGGIIYTTTDEFWRWRSGRGEKVYEQFWVQLIRSTQTNKHSYTNKSIQIETNGSQYHPGTPVVFTVLIPPHLHVSNDLQTIEAAIAHQTNPETTRLQLIKSTTPNTFTGTWTPKISGNHNIKTKVNTQNPDTIVEAGFEF